MTGAVAGAAVPGAAGLAEQLARDGSALIAALRSPWTWLLAAALVVLMLGAWRARRLIEQDRRLAPRVRELATASIHAASVAVLAIAVAWFLWRRAPLFLGIALAALAAAAGLGVGLRGRAWVWGLATIWRGRVRIGDRLRLGAIDGRVADVGLFGVLVIGDDGARVLVPHGKLAGEAFSVASPEEVHPAEAAVRAAGDRELTEADLEALRRIGALCPYRQQGGVVAVTLAADRRSAAVAFRSWSEEGARLAREHVQRAFAAAEAEAADAAAADAAAAGAASTPPGG